MPQPIRKYFRMDLPSDDGGTFSQHVIRAAESEAGLKTLVGPDRAVIFQSLVTAGDHEVAYVSTGAVELLRRAGVSVKIEPTPVQITDLPDGLALLIGDAVDVEEYSRLRDR